MLQKNEIVRKIAANYIFWPDNPLVKNGYVEISACGEVRVVDTQGKIKEMAGLEFYGGMIVPAYIGRHAKSLRPGMELLPFLERQFARYGWDCDRVAIIEGADLVGLVWTEGAAVRLL
ncbi:MAG: hypothetical protein K2L23_00630 [Odoribacter sp.]|nr:hypothetical protein [Odoribacter sp.]